MSMGHTFCVLSWKIAAARRDRDRTGFVSQYLANALFRSLNMIAGIREWIQRIAHRVNAYSMDFIAKDYLRFVIYLARHRTRSITREHEKEASAPASLDRSGFLRMREIGIPHCYHSDRKRRCTVKSPVLNECNFQLIYTYMSNKINIFLKYMY